MFGKYVLSICAATMLPLAFSSAHPAMITVNSLTDPGAPGIRALRGAITAANSQTRVNGCKKDSGNDTIDFSISGTIIIAPLNFAVMEITDSQLTINGPIALTCNPSAEGGISVAAGATVKLNKLTFTASIGDCFGAAIQNEGALTIANSTVTQLLRATFNSGTMTVINSTFTKNFGDVGFGPSALGNFGGTLTITNSTVSDNIDWTVENEGQATITNTTFSGNRGKNIEAILNGDFDDTNGLLIIVNSTFSGNVQRPTAGRDSQSWQADRHQQYLRRQASATSKRVQLLGLLTMALYSESPLAQ